VKVMVRISGVCDFPARRGTARPLVRGSCPAGHYPLE
jgi:hypothetical protein